MDEIMSWEVQRRTTKDIERMGKCHLELVPEPRDEIVTFEEVQEMVGRDLELIGRCHLTLVTEPTEDLLGDGGTSE
jgi:hypothetical protein